VWLVRTITTLRAIGFGLGLASTGMLFVACTDRAMVVMPPGASRSEVQGVTSGGPGGSHNGHGATAGLEDELAQIRMVTAAFHRVEAAEAAGYELGYVNGSGVKIITGCVAHPTAGAMGYHYFNKALVDDLVVDPLKPEALVYAPGPNGALQLAAVEYVVPGAASNPPGVSEPPTVLGSEMVILVPAVGFYTLHAWVWRNNPAGMLAHWNPSVVCP
jgi:hypothetical protein